MAVPVPGNSPPLLSLDTLVTGPTVAIDGVPYRLKTRLQLGIVPGAKLAIDGRRMEELNTRQPNLTVPEAEELASLIDNTCRAVLDAPDHVHQKLSDNQRLDVCWAFIGLHSSILPTTGATPLQAPDAQATGAKSSRRSRGSSAARRANG